MKKLTDTLISILLILLTSFFILCRLYGINFYCVLSGSMEPAIHTGSVVLINKNNKDVTAGDIIAFTKGDITVTHRVYKTYKDYVLTKGDANNLPDAAPIAREQIIGKVLLTLPYLGYFITYIKTPYGKVLILAMAVFYICLTVIKSKIKENQNEKT